MNKQFEVLAVNVAFLGQTFPKGTLISKEEWAIQADAFNAKKAANMPELNIDDVFEHLEERQIIKVVEEEEIEEVEEVVLPVAVKRGRRGKK
jgi:hypothetical protein